MSTSIQCPITGLSCERDCWVRGSKCLPNRPRQALFDEECLALADHFLADEVSPATKAQRYSLAAAIQTAVEDWFTLEQIAQGDGPQEGAAG